MGKYIVNIDVRQGKDERFRWFVNAYIDEQAKCVAMSTRSWEFYMEAHNDAARVFPQYLTELPQYSPEV